MASLCGVGSWSWRRRRKHAHGSVLSSDGPVGHFAALHRLYRYFQKPTHSVGLFPVVKDRWYRLHNFHGGHWGRNNGPMADVCAVAAELQMRHLTLAASEGPCSECGWQATCCFTRKNGRRQGYWKRHLSITGHSSVRLRTFLSNTGACQARKATVAEALVRPPFRPKRASNRTTSSINPLHKPRPYSDSCT